MSTIRSSMLTPKFWKRFRQIFGGLFIFGVINILSVITFILLNYDHQMEGKSECAVVFGAAVWRDDQPSHALYDRVHSGITLYKNKQVSCLIMSGGPSVYGAHEADVMKKLALESGVVATHIYLDYEGVSTQKTLENLVKNFPSVASFVMVSNDFHLARIRLMAWKLKLPNVSLQTAKYNEGRYVKESYFFGREILGNLYYFWIWHPRNSFMPLADQPR